MTEPWWKTAVIYQVYPRSFADADGDGVGDLRGLIDQLDHLAWLGVDAVWLSPIFRSPMADFGYDVADYCDVDPVFGTLADADDLIASAHERGMKVLLDWVPNHSSDQHPWFVESRSGPASPKRDWYVWRDSGPDGGPPNNWRAAFSDAPAWTFDPASGQWYLHLFLPEQPDLNWGNPEVVEAMHGTLRFWLDRGVDGFRADVIHAIGKDPALPDDPPELRAEFPHASLNDDPRTHELLRGLRSLIDSYDGDRMMVGEVYLLDTAKVATYYGDSDELHLSFNFPPLYTSWKATSWGRRLTEVSTLLGPRDAWPTWVLSNHDNVRHRSRYGSEARARAAAVLLLGLRGTPFLYAGEELGLEDAEVPVDRVVDPGGRDGCRAPVPWTRADGHGWGPSPWLPFPPDAAARSVEALREDKESILWLYRRLLAARRASVALTVGDQDVLLAPDGVLCWLRSSGDDRRVVAVNFGAVPASLYLDGEWDVEVASDGAGESLLFGGSLPGDTAVVLRPA